MLEIGVMVAPSSLPDLIVFAFTFFLIRAFFSFHVMSPGKVANGLLILLS